MGQVILTVIFIVIWLPSILFTMNNSATTPPLQESAILQGPYKWKYQDRDYSFVDKHPRFSVYGEIETVDGLKPIVSEASFIEWLYPSSSRLKSNIRIFYTALRERPFVTESVLENDNSLAYNISGFRFNWIFVPSVLFCIILPIFYFLLLLSDSVVIDSPEQRKRKSNDFISLVKSIEQRANNDSNWLKNKTLSIAFLGYFVVISSVLLMIPVGVGLFGSIAFLTSGNILGLKIAFFLALVPLGFSWNMAKSLLITGYSYKGAEIKRKDSPSLFELLDTICEKAKGPKFTRIYINDNYNASVTRSDGLLGFFGMGPIVLTLGLPLMQSMTQKQLMGVIGHEYGHVAAKDNAWGQWIYRIRNSWLILGDRLGLDRLWYALKLNRFYEWFIATFSAHSFALSRHCEYEADAFSSRLVGKEAMGEALSALVFFSHQYDELFWKQIWSRCDSGNSIQYEQPYSAIPAFFSSLDQDPELVSFALKQKTNYSATHPSISDRLHALSTKFKLLKVTPETASSQLLGKMELSIIDHFNQKWRQGVEENWLQRQEEYTALHTKFNELEHKNLPDLTDDDLWNLISIASSLDKNQLFYDASTDMLRRYPDNIDAQLNCIWFQLIVNKDSHQLSVMEDFVQKHPQYLANICRYAIEFLESTSRQDEASTYYERLRDWEYTRSAAEDERALVLASDEYKPHALSNEEIADFIGYYSKHPIISKVFIAQKQVKYMPEFPSYLIAYETKANFWSTQKKVDAKVEDFIYESGLSSEFSFISVDSIKGLKNKISKVKGANVYIKA